MLGRLYATQDCSAARALELVGERWTLLILRDALFNHYTRFSQYQRSLAIAPNILTKRLSALVNNGILLTRAASDQPNHLEYLPTEMGHTLKPVIVALTTWGDRWVRLGPVSFVHEDCGGRVVQQFSCARCTDRVDPKAVQVRQRLERTGHVSTERDEMRSSTASSARERPSRPRKRVNASRRVRGMHWKLYDL